MKKTNTNLMLCAMVFAVALVISNVITAKTIQTGIPLFGSTILVPSAVICYCVTFLMTDVIGEIWGRKEARTVVLGGFACQVLATCLILVGEVLPAADPSMQAAYDMLLGQNAVFVIASMTAYLLAQSWDVFIFHRIRNHVLANGGTSRSRWIWNNASTMTSQLIDTVVFIGIAFGIGFGWLFDPAMIGQLGAMMVGQYLCKFVLAALDTPFFYLLTRREQAGMQTSASNSKG
ncbi:MAG: VUT family protein [Coriobacteriaceae bacterium]|nr:VUT family protein [Coriobacteriaceae bacterium]